jgi:hypothetical protein
MCGNTWHHGKETRSYKYRISSSITQARRTSDCNGSSNKEIRTAINISIAQAVIINPSSVVTYVYPQPIEDSQLVATAAAQETAIEKYTGEIYFPDPNNKTKQHLVYIQKGDENTTKGFTAPWALHCYGPLKQGASAIAWDDGAKGKPVDSAEMKKASKAFNLTRQTVPIDTGDSNK